MWQSRARTGCWGTGNHQQAVFIQGEGPRNARNTRKPLMSPGSLATEYRDNGRIMPEGVLSNATGPSIRVFRVFRGCLFRHAHVETSAFAMWPSGSKSIPGRRPWPGTIHSEEQ